MGTPLENMRTIMRANRAGIPAPRFNRDREMFDGDDDTHWRTFPSEGPDSEGKMHGGSPHLIRKSDGMIMDEAADGKPGKLAGITVHELKAGKKPTKEDRAAVKEEIKEAEPEKKEEPPKSKTVPLQTSDHDPMWDTPKAPGEVQSKQTEYDPVSGAVAPNKGDDPPPTVESPAPEPEPANEPAKAESAADDAARGIDPVGREPVADDGGNGSGEPVGATGQGKGAAGKISTIRPELTAPADTSLVSESLQKHLAPHQLQASARAIAAIDKHGGALNISGTGCIAEGTRIFNPVTGEHVPVEILHARMLPSVVLSLIGEDLVPSIAGIPFVKGCADLYRVTTQSGNVITVTAKHRFLSPDGWKSISDEGFSVGSLLRSASVRPPSISGIAISTHAEDDRHLMGKHSAPLDDCRISLRPDRDEQPRMEAGICQVSSPSRVDARGHIHGDLRVGGSEFSREHSHPRQSYDRHSRNSFSPSKIPAPASIAIRVSSSGTQLHDPEPQGIRRFLEEKSSLRQSGGEVRHHLPSSLSQRRIASESGTSARIPVLRIERNATTLGNSSRVRERLPRVDIPPQFVRILLDQVFSCDSCKYDSAWDRIASIEYAGNARFFDLRVPGPDNYVAEGLVHHNSGKTRSNLAVAKTYLDQGKKVLIVAPTAVLRPDFEGKAIQGSYNHDSAAMGIPLNVFKGEEADGDWKEVEPTTLDRATADEKLTKLRADAKGNEAANRDGRDVFRLNKKTVKGATTFGISRQRIKNTQLDPKTINITTYDRFGDIKDQIDGNTVIVYDEAAEGKNWQSQIAKDMKEAGKAAHGVLYATATPADKPMHVSAYERAGVFGTRHPFETFKELGMRRVEKHVGGGRVATVWERDPGVSDDEAHRRMSGLFDRMTQEGLATKHEVSMDNSTVENQTVPLPPEAHQLMQRIAANYTPRQRAQSLMAQRLQQEPYKIQAAVDSVKADLAAGRRPIIFAGRVNASTVGGEDGDDEDAIAHSEGTLKTLREALAREGINDVSEIHGGVSDAVRARGADDFQAGKNRVLIGTVNSAGTGLNLDDTVGNAPRTLTNMTAPFSANEVVQAAGRINRLSTKSPAIVRNLYSDTDVDDWNRGITESKLRMLAGAVGGDVRKLDVDYTPEAQTEPYQWPSLIGGSRGGANDITPRKAGQGYVHSIPMTPQLREMLNSPNRPRWMRLNEYKGKQSVDVWGDNSAQVIERVGHAKSGKIPEATPPPPRPESPPAPIAAPPLDRTGKIAAVMTPEHKASIHAGLRHMAAMDDDRARELNGMGFNKMDSEFGGKLAEMGDLSDRQAAAGAAMLGKYKRQLPTQIHEHIGDLMKKAGEREEEEAAKIAAAPPAPEDPNVRIRGNTFPHKDELKRLGFRWDGNNKVWYRPRAGFNPSRLPRGLSHYRAEMEYFSAICVSEVPLPIHNLRTIMQCNRAGRVAPRFNRDAVEHFAFEEEKHPRGNAGRWVKAGDDEGDEVKLHDTEDRVVETPAHLRHLRGKTEKEVQQHHAMTSATPDELAGGVNERYAKAYHVGKELAHKIDNDYKSAVRDIEYIPEDFAKKYRKLWEDNPDEYGHVNASVAYAEATKGIPEHVLELFPDLEDELTEQILDDDSEGELPDERGMGEKVLQDAKDNGLASAIVNNAWDNQEDIENVEPAENELKQHWNDQLDENDEVMTYERSALGEEADTALAHHALHSTLSDISPEMPKAYEGDWDDLVSSLTEGGEVDPDQFSAGSTRRNIPQMVRIMQGNLAAEQFDSAHWEESKHPRNHGKWTDGAGSSRTTSAPKTIRQRLKQKWGETTGKQKLKAAVHSPLKVEHAVKAGMKGFAEYARDLWKGSGSDWDKPSKPIDPSGLAGKVIGGMKMASKGVLKLAFVSWIAGQKAVEAVARAKGMSAEDAAKLRTLVTCYDAVNCKAIVAGLHMSGVGAALAAPSTFIPTASVAYLAHAAATDFPAVKKAATDGVKKAAKAIMSGYETPHGPSAYFEASATDEEKGVDAKAKRAVGVLADAIKKHSGSSWYFALLSEAMEVAESAEQATEIAGKAFTQTSPPTSP